MQIYQEPDLWESECKLIFVIVTREYVSTWWSYYLTEAPRDYSNFYLKYNMIYKEELW